ncbi:MAG: bifunctional folylpolyglutamate synthase/dihydrofolate synthase [Bacteroidetes bacterium]|uniref:bifunctional folylpolyglutamate synthase/dihydrofolate synthase n=1 Tax=Phnomibacter sp. TaxID=2836217 RepID=UPI002FDDA477|nr:bifunctional folylpolyglutamate synthase/dihydrofolate synthase [Bacteroidota bacterium]
MTYQQTIDYLYARLPMFTRIGAAAYKKDLHNTIALLNAIGNPQQQFKSIHIAGTNGKGSTSHMLAAILQTHGYKTGLYTSPHLVDFRERIKINGDWIDADFIVAFTEQIKPVIEAIEPSFFEVTVALAFAWFAQQQVDIAVIETGLGGRLDSTNIITPELSIITNIGWDHMNLLGNTLPEIAAEKAGIIKPGIPAVVGEYLPETKDVFVQQASRCNSPLVFAADAFNITQVASTPQALTVSLHNIATDETISLTTDLGGLYQQYNLRTLYSSCLALQQAGWPLQLSLIQEALQEVKKSTGLHGRWEVLRTLPLLVLDVAHNVNGIQQVLQQLQHWQQQYSGMQVHIVIGMVRDKDIDQVLTLLPKEYHYYFTQAQLPRALPAPDMQQQAAQHHLHGEVFTQVNDAIAAAMHAAQPQDLVLVCGSVFVVGEADLARWEEKQIVS